ncbi:hypothetical protein H920_06921 [Fukomys damarensis]|uniref:Uncharacterized protein n=1 Tax=Fukomys damarensis TaxID=885580 RepID=A0A091DKZ1_FUKDA|nr:hypothetical protein H920_06921 [Fukomys damarensis]
MGNLQHACHVGTQTQIGVHRSTSSRLSWAHGPERMSAPSGANGAGAVLTAEVFRDHMTQKRPRREVFGIMTHDIRRPPCFDMRDREQGEAHHGTPRGKAKVLPLQTGGRSLAVLQRSLELSVSRDGFCSHQEALVFLMSITSWLHCRSFRLVAQILHPARADFLASTTGRWAFWVQILNTGKHETLLWAPGPWLDSRKTLPWTLGLWLDLCGILPWDPGPQLDSLGLSYLARSLALLRIDFLS